MLQYHWPLLKQQWQSIKSKFMNTGSPQIIHMLDSVQKNMLCLMGLVSAVGIHLGMQHIPILHLVSSGMQNTALLHPTPLQYLEIYISILMSSKLYQ